MTAKTRSFVFACALGASVSVLAIPTASAITWNFNTPSGTLGTTQPYMVSGVTLTAAGFSSAAALNPGPANVALFGKNDGGSENGLGLVNDPTGDHEISGTNLIQIAMAAGLSNVMFQMGSTTGSDAWEVWGSNVATALGAPLIAFGNDEGPHALPFFNFYSFGAAGFLSTSGNVLLASISASPVAVPGPIVGAGLPGLIAACAGLLALARRRRREIA